MPRIEPIPFEDLSEDTRCRIEAGTATGMYTTPVPLQIMAHSPLAVRALDDGYKAHFRAGSLGPRLQELLRLRSAQLSACQPCSVSRKDDTVSEQDVAFLADPDQGRIPGKNCWRCVFSICSPPIRPSIPCPPR